MNWQALVDPHVSGRLCLTLFHSIWQVALLAAIAWNIDRIVRKTSVEWSYALHVTALVLGFTAVAITYAVVPIPATTNNDAMEITSAPEPVVFPQPPMPTRSVVQFKQQNVRQALSTTLGSFPEPIATWKEDWSAIWLRIAPWLAGIYAIGVVLMLIRLVADIVKAQRLSILANPIMDGPVVESLRVLSKRWSVRVVPILAQAEYIVIPKVVGVLKPTILLPAAALTGLSTSELEMILAHELAHVSRYDMWVNLLQRLAEVVLFFNPALWHLSRRISSLREYCCDELTCHEMSTSDVEPRIRYATALLRVAELAKPSEFSHRNLAALAASGRCPSELRRRVARLLGEPLREPVRVSRRAAFTFAILALLLVTVPTVWNPRADSASAMPADTVADDSGTNDADTSASPEETKTEDDVEEPGEYSVPITVFGKAIDSDGIPITGAEVFLASRLTDEEPLAIAKTDEVGAYRFESVLLPIIPAFTNDSVDIGALELFGRADGFGFSWRPLKWFYPNSAHVDGSVAAPWVGPGYGRPKGFGRDDPIELNLTFGPPASLRGRVVDDRGEPIAETVVVIRNAHYWGDDNPRREYESNWLFVPKSVKTLTDEYGRFVFGTLPANHVFKLDVRPPGNPPRMIYGATRDGVESCHGRRVYSGVFDVIFAQPRKVKFHVVYGDTGKPAPKVGVGGREFKAGFWVTTDVDGNVETPLPDGQYQISMSPRFGTPYLETKVNVIVSAETSTKPIKLELRPAAVIDITVVDADTREPLSGVDVWWWDDGRIPGIVPTRTVRGYRSWEVETGISHYERPRSDEHGKMRVLFEPGKHRIGVGLHSFPKGYKPVNPNGKHIECQSGEAISVEFHMRNPMNGDPTNNS